MLAELFLTMLSILIYIFLLKKFNFNFKGLEIILFEVSFFSFAGESVLQILGCITFILLVIYYILKTMKTKQSTSYIIVTLYMILFYVNVYMIIPNLSLTGFADMALGLMLIVGNVIIIFEIIILNLILNYKTKEG